MKITTLYICYQSVLEPLTQTQVIAYLEGLAGAGYRIVLLTFEPRRLTRNETLTWHKRLERQGIHWRALRYHKRPSAPATAWDILVGSLYGLYLVRRYNVRLVHARSHVPGVMALVLKRLTGERVLFDVRGFMAEEYVDAGTWPAGGWLFRATKRVERALVQASDGIVLLTNKAEHLLRHWYPDAVAGKPIEVIPCCVDFRPLPPSAKEAPDRFLNSSPVSFVYAGKFGGAYRADAMAAFVAIAKQSLPNVHWDVWTQSDPALAQRVITALELEDVVALGQLPADAMPCALARATVGLSFPDPSFSKLAMSPTKIGEYLGAGLPVVSTSGIGDVDELLTGSGEHSHGPVGVLVRDFTEEAYQEALVELLALLDDPRTPARCRAVAREQLDLEAVCWTRYRGLYEQLIGPPVELPGPTGPSRVCGA